MDSYNYGKKKIHFLNFFCSFVEFAYNLGLAFHYLVGWLEVMLNIYAKLALWQVLHMADRCLDHKVLAEKFIDGICLCRGFYDDE